MVQESMGEDNANSRSLKAETPVQGVKIVLVEGKGRGMVATQAFKAGDVIIEEAPYAAVVSSQAIDSVCSGLLSPLTDAAVASMCGGCKLVR
jgi:hydrogenase maturation factor HypE